MAKFAAPSFSPHRWPRAKTRIVEHLRNFGQDTPIFATYSFVMVNKANTMTKAAAYAARFNKVFDYIEQHLDDELSIETLSQIAHFSKYHFHRQFSEFVGISAAKYVQLMRLKRASYQLVFKPQTRIADIALDAAFENPESFSRAFKNTFGQSPSQFRRHAAWAPWNERYTFPTRIRSQNMQVTIVDCDPIQIAVFEHRGAPALVNESVQIFIKWRQHSALSPIKTNKTFGVIYDNPETTPAEKFRFDVCAEISGDTVPANTQGVIAKTIPGGRCAVMRHLGSHDRIGDSARYLYQQWLPESGEELRDFPLYFHYINLIPDTLEHDLITDIYLPLK